MKITTGETGYVGLANGVYLRGIMKLLEMISYSRSKILHKSFHSDDSIQRKPGITVPQDKLGTTIQVCIGQRFAQHHRRFPGSALTATRAR